MCKGYAQQGMTLLELLVTTLILSITLTAGVPALNRFSDRNAARQQITQLKQIISYTRLQASVLGTRVSLCPMQNNQCTSNWNQTLTVFTDPNNNHVVDSGETLLRYFRASDSDREYRHYNRSALSFDGRGYAGGYNGSFSYCYRASVRTGAALIISRNGRIRAGLDSDQDGLPETAGGKNVSCAAN